MAGGISGPVSLVFGATGGVGSAVGPAAREGGAKVVLALRDPEKPVPGLSAEDERAAGYERVQADLGRPESVAAAVRRTGATRAFIYAFLQSPDHMRATAEALKGAGVEFVVLLSSGGVRGEARDVGPDQFIPYRHAQTELVLEDVFGPGGYVAVRPGYFSTNLLWWKEALKRGGSGGPVQVTYPEVKMDFIDPRDIGRVCGAILAAGKAADGQNNVPLLGPEFASMADGIDAIAAATGRTVQIQPLSGDEAVAWMRHERGLPQPMVAYLVSMFATRAAQAAGGGPDSFTEGPYVDEARGNIPKYTGKPATGLKAWVQENKHEFVG